MPKSLQLPVQSALAMTAIPALFPILSLLGASPASAQSLTDDGYRKSGASGYGASRYRTHGYGAPGPVWPVPAE